MFAFSGNTCDGKWRTRDQKALGKAISTHVEVDSLASDEVPATVLESLEAVKDATSSKVETAVTNGEVVFNNLLEELEKVLGELTLKDEPADKEVDRATQLVQAYFFKEEPEFKRVMVYRDRGWNHNTDKGDTYFKTQRENADKADEEREKRFFIMMVRIGEDMNAATGALNPPVSAGRNMKVLDVCMAPGGYSAAVLKIHPAAEIFGLTLPKNEGGVCTLLNPFINEHSLMIPLSKLRGIKYADVTMLAAELLKGTDKIIPTGFLDSAKINPLRPFVSHKMDLVFLDGIALRTHERAPYRQKTEPLRLSTAQIILGMQRVIQGGTMVMLMHKVDSWASFSIVSTISKFAEVELFKPKTAHATRSSFYLVAKHVDVESPLAAAAVAEWKRQWYAATFGDPEGIGESREPQEEFVLSLLKDFGPKLRQMGVPIWRTQADALAKSTFAGDVCKTFDVEKEEV